MPGATWVVYSISTKDRPEGVRAVCEQREWAAMDAAKPGHFSLIQGGMTNEGEAERLARGTSGEAKPRNSKPAATAWADKAAAGLDETKVAAG